jgi:plastocyanin
MKSKSHNQSAVVIPRLQNLLLASLLIFLAACNFPGAPSGTQPTLPPPAESPPEEPGNTAPPAAPGETAPPATEPAVPLTGQGQTFEVSIADSNFSPAELTVPVGSTVVWTHNGSLPHTVTADDGSFDSGTLAGGDAFEFTFNQSGTFLYHCEFHGNSGGQGMSAAVTVSGSAAPPAPTTAPTQAAPAAAPTAAAATAAVSPPAASTPTTGAAAPTAEPTTVAPAEATGGVAFTSAGVVNRDTTQASLNPSVAVGTTTAGGPLNSWITWAEDSPGGVRQIFASELVDGAFQPRGASLNIHTNVLADFPSITFAGENRLVPWVAWVEPSPGFGNVAQIFASRFNTTSGLWQQAGQDRGGSEASLNLHTNRTASRPFIFSGTGDPAQPPVAWVTWEELSSLSAQAQIFVTKAVRDETAIGGFRWEFVGILNEIQEPSLNIDRFRQALHPTGVFAETGNAVPWVTWHESGGGRPERVFTARGVADASAPGGFKWSPVPACTPDETVCSLNINPLQDAKDASMAAGSLTPGEATVPWIAWAERGPTGKWQVFVNRLDLTTRNSFLPVGGSLNIDPNHDARTPIITFVGNVPYVAWLEDNGSGQFELQVRHLAPDLQSVNWIVDTPEAGFNSNPGLTLSGLAAAGSPESLFLSWVEGDPLVEAAQLVAGLLQP